MSCVDETGPMVATIFVLRRASVTPADYRQVILTNDARSSAAATTRDDRARTLPA
jgi:hypothetical protein